MKPSHCLILALLVMAPLSASSSRQEVVSLIVMTSITLHIDPLLGLAIASNESDLYPKATSPKRRDGSCDRGLFQINSNYNDELFGLYLPGTDPDPYDPWKSAYVGLSHFKAMVKQLGTVEEGLLGYNMGAAKYLSLKGSLIPENHPYVRAVLSRYRALAAKADPGRYQWNLQLSHPQLSPSQPTYLSLEEVTMPSWYYLSLISGSSLCGRDDISIPQAGERLTWPRRRPRAVRAGPSTSRTPAVPMSAKHSLKYESAIS